MNKNLLKTVPLAIGLAVGMTALTPIDANAQASKRILDSENYEQATAADWSALAASTVTLVTGDEVYGFTMPLVTDKNGKKFGKSEGNAFWLDKSKTSSYEIYQYLLNSDDEKVIEYLKIFTFLTKEEIEDIEKQQISHPETRIAQKTLAKEVVTFLHGEKEAEKAKEMSEALFSGHVKNLTKKEIEDVFKGVPTFETENNINIIDMLVNNKIASSKREAREFVNAGSITINEEKITDENYIVTKEIAIDNEILVLRRGKKKYFIGKIKL